MKDRDGDRWKENQPKVLIDRARTLRKTETGAERALWARLRNRQLAGLKFRRQVPLNHYILDFFCGEAKLCIEIDGSEHLTNAAQKHDVVRDKYLAHHDIVTVRISSRDVFVNIDGVLQQINLIAQRRMSPSSPSPLGKGPG